MGCVCGEPIFLTPPQSRKGCKPRARPQRIAVALERAEPAVAPLPGVSAARWTAVAGPELGHHRGPQTLQVARARGEDEVDDIVGEREKVRRGGGAACRRQ